MTNNMTNNMTTDIQAASQAQEILLSPQSPPFQQQQQPARSANFDTDHIHDRMMGRMLSGFVILALVSFASSAFVGWRERQLIIFTLLGYMLCMIWSLYLSKKAVLEEQEHHAKARAQDEEQRSKQRMGLISAEDAKQLGRLAREHFEERQERLLGQLFGEIRDAVFDGQDHVVWIVNPVEYLQYKLGEKLKSLGYSVNPMTDQDEPWTTDMAEEVEPSYYVVMWTE
jgi:hypothetical protein